MIRKALFETKLSITTRTSESVILNLFSRKHVQNTLFLNVFDQLFWMMSDLDQTVWALRYDVNDYLYVLEVV